MRTSKKLFLFVLAAIMAGSMLVPPTFSWYDHSGTQIGGIMKYERTSLPVSNGKVTMETKRLKMNESDPTLLYYDDRGQKQTEGNALQTDSVNTGSVRYYQTVFTNTKNSPAMVNLYLTNYTNEPGLYLGTIYPTITEKNQAGQASKIPESRGSVRVYFEDRDTTGWKASENVVRYVVTNGGAHKIALERTPKNEKGGIAVSRSTADSNWVYSADLPAGTTSFYFYSSMGDNHMSDGWYKTRTFTEIKSGVIYYLTQKAVQDSSNNAECKELVMNKLASASQYYGTITMSQNQYVDVTLGDSYYTGESISYVATGNSVSLDANTNILTRTSTASNATLTTTVTGVLGDVIQLTTNITTPALLDSVPVVMNLKVPPKDEKISESSDESKGTREVVWYIRNDGSQAGTFSSIIFTK